MHKMLVLYPPPVDPAAFRDYYERTHLPLAAKLPGLRAMRHSFDLTGVGQDAPYFAVWEGEFDDAAAMAASMSSPQGQAVSADVPNYATGGAIVVHYPVTEGRT